MQKKQTIIITGGGAPGIAGTIYSLKNNPDQTIFRIIAVDIRKNVVGKHLSDKFYQISPPEDKNYLDRICKIAEKENARIILPQTTRETKVLAKLQNKLAAQGIVVVTSVYSSIKRANDKYLLYKIAEKKRIPCPRHFLTKDKESFKEAAILLGYPRKKIVIKPRESFGMRGLRVLTNKPFDLARFFNEKPTGIEVSLETLIAGFSQNLWPQLLVMEYLPGKEYTVDVFIGKKGKVIIPRLREEIRSGISFSARVDIRKDLINYATKLSEALNLRYCFGFQFRADRHNKLKLLECNPRVQGTMATSTFAGFNIIYAAVKEAMGENVKLNRVRLKDGTEFKRYWGGLAIYNNELIDRI